MINKLVSVLILIIILVGLSSLAFEIPFVEAQETIIIRINGNVEPYDAPLTQTDAYTYTFTDDAETGMGLYVELDGVVIDGAGYALTGLEEGIGVNLPRKQRVKIVDLIVQGFETGISLRNSSLCSIINTTVSDNRYNGIRLRGSSHNNVIFGNIISNNTEDGLDLDEASYNNWIHGNTMKENADDGIDLGEDSINNHIYNNNFIDNVNQVGSFHAANYWNTTYSQGGNYWSNYPDKYPSPIDEKSGPNQDQPGNDGIWDNAYTLYDFDTEEIDQYPLVGPYVVTNFDIKAPSSIDVSPSKNEYTPGVMMKVRGRIKPFLSGETVKIFYFHEPKKNATRYATTQHDGSYENEYKAAKEDKDEGWWVVYVSWEGNDRYYGAEDKTSFKVREDSWIPGFPWESILIGALLGLVTINLLRKKKMSASSTFN